MSECVFLSLYLLSSFCNLSLLLLQDKTFGLKNKKGAKQQKFIQQVQHQVKYGGNKSARELEKDKESQVKKKDDLKKNLAEINAIFKPVQQTAGKGEEGDREGGWEGVQERRGGGYKERRKGGR